MNIEPSLISTKITNELPDVLEYTGEFGPELVLFLPFCERLSQQGLLLNRTICTYAGMEGFYDQIKCRTVHVKNEDRRYVPPEQRPRWMPIKNEHKFDVELSKQVLRYPDLRSRFTRIKLPPEIANSEKPLLVIHNKYNKEWGGIPTNFIPLKSLDLLFGTFEPFFTIIYIRHSVDPGIGFSKDHNLALAFDDTSVLKEHPSVRNFEDMFKSGSQYDLNTLKNGIYSRCHWFISSQGGGAHHIALFSGSLIAILHRKGHEIEWAYSSGYYTFMADPAPTTLVCTTEEDLQLLPTIFLSSQRIGPKVHVGYNMRHQLESLSPNRLCEPTHSGL
jgi:hypothetical protein